MTLHLIKLCVGADSVLDLAQWQAARLCDKKRSKQEPELIHITRHRPKRAEEILEGGSLYWVMKGRIVARQKLLELRPMVIDGVRHCGLVYDKELVLVRPYPHRPFQGWRYLDEKSAPPDIAVYRGDHKNANSLHEELMALGLV